MHATAINFAVRYTFRLGMEGGNYYLLDTTGRRVDVANGPSGRHTATQAIRMMRRHVVRRLAVARAAVPSETEGRRKAARFGVHQLIGSSTT